MYSSDSNRVNTAKLYCTCAMHLTSRCGVTYQGHRSFVCAHKITPCALCSPGDKGSFSAQPFSGPKAAFSEKDYVVQNYIVCK